jgi:L-ribulose-5-phosphate 4-epimerase
MKSVRLHGTGDLQTHEESIPAVLVYSHGSFTWSNDAMEAVHNSVVLEEVAFMHFHTMLLEPNILPMQQELLDKHYLRKHGANAYYRQTKSRNKESNHD